MHIYIYTHRLSRTTPISERVDQDPTMKNSDEKQR
jgi:hypothetical protein